MDKVIMDPYNFQIELVEGCNRRCKFCGIYSITGKNKRKGNMKYMPIKTVKKLAKEIGERFDHKRVEFAMHGEPTLHPNLFSIVNEFRHFAKLCQLQITTNGSKLNFAMMKELFACGINIIIVDVYENENQRIAELTEIAHILNICVYDYYKGLLNPYQYNSHKLRAVVFMRDIGKLSGKTKTRVVSNHAGNSNPKALLKMGITPALTPLDKKCSKPFREMVVHYDGTVPICCMDWRHELILGKFPETSLEDIWTSNMFEVVRWKLFHKQRNMVPCHFCDYNGGFRIGLLKEPEPPFFAEPRILKKHLKKFKKFAYSNARTLPKQGDINEFLQRY